MSDIMYKKKRAPSVAAQLGNWCNRRKDISREQLLQFQRRQKLPYLAGMLLQSKSCSTVKMLLQYKSCYKT